MADRKRIIEGLEQAKDVIERWIPIFEQYNTPLAIECAIALLKKQEPKTIIYGNHEEYWGQEAICPDCGKHWMSADETTTHYCPGCGRAVQTDA